MLNDRNTKRVNYMSVTSNTVNAVKLIYVAYYKVNNDMYCINQSHKIRRKNNSPAQTHTLSHTQTHTRNILLSLIDVASQRTIFHFLINFLLHHGGFE